MLSININLGQYGKEIDEKILSAREKGTFCGLKSCPIESKHFQYSVILTQQPKVLVPIKDTLTFFPELMTFLLLVDDENGWRREEPFKDKKEVGSHDYHQYALFFSLIILSKCWSHANGLIKIHPCIFTSHHYSTITNYT